MRVYKVQLQPLAMPGATRSSAPTISTPSMHPRPSCDQTGSLERTRCRKNLLSLLNYRHQLKGEDMKYGMLLGVDAVLFYQFKDEASDIVWKRTKWCKTFFIRNLTCHTHTEAILTPSVHLQAAAEEGCILWSWSDASYRMIEGPVWNFFLFKSD